MSKVNISINLNQSAIDKIKEAAGPALEMTMDALATEVENKQVVPFRDGILKDSESHGVVENKGFISWDTPYARRLYYHPEYNFSKEKHVNAQGLWMDYWIHGDGRNWLTNAAGQFLKQKSGGVIK
ncbi:hypothetical protein [Peptostreptococcus anaerobius]|mgnify:FL=1|uniref:hypothetical protein n=1 Tax=Peptostreptococcus anaerobius TaxID=1261 RepID=UPI003D6F5C63